MARRGRCTTRLRLVSYRELRKVAEKIGFQWVRQEGSHNTFRNEGGRIIVIPDHGSRLGSLVAMLSQGGARIEKVSLGQTDLEDVFVEFAKSPGADGALSE